MPFCKLQNSLVIRGPGQLLYYLLAPSRLLWGPGLRLHTLSFLIPPTGLLSPSLHEFHFSSCSRMLYCKLQHAFLIHRDLIPVMQEPCPPKLSLPPPSGHHPIFSKPRSPRSTALAYLRNMSCHQRRSIALSRQTSCELQSCGTSCNTSGHTSSTCTPVPPFKWLYVFVLIGDGRRELIPYVLFNGHLIQLMCNVLQSITLT